MRRTVLRVVCVLLVSAPALAQAPITRGPLPATAKVEWDAPQNVTTVTEAQSFEPRLLDNGVPLTALTNVSCQGTPIVCAAPLTASNRDALNRVGAHELRLTLFRVDVGESPPSSPFVLTSPAGAPVNLRLMP